MAKTWKMVDVRKTLRKHNWRTVGNDVVELCRGWHVVLGADKDTLVLSVMEDVNPDKIEGGAFVRAYVRIDSEGAWFPKDIDRRTIEGTDVPVVCHYAMARILRDIVKIK